MTQLVCTECGEKLPADASPTRLTCSDEESRAAGRGSCKEARKRRLKRARDRERRSKHHGPSGGVDYSDTAMHQATTGAIDEVGHEVIAEELRPLVREALTDNVLLALRRLVGLTDDVVTRLAQDVNSNDAVVRQKAHTLVLRYVLGHGAVQPKDEAERAQFIVHFDSMPRPDTDSGERDTETPEFGEPEEPVDLRPCEDCGVEKPETDFDNEAPRCRECVAAYREEKAAEFGLDG